MTDLENIIICYTWEQAIEDGDLILLEEKIVAEAGFKCPIAVTRSVWENYITWSNDYPVSDSKKQNTYQDFEGRLWDVLHILRSTIKSNNNKDTGIINFYLYIVPRDGKSQKPKHTELKSVYTCDENGNPVITIMLPDED